MVISEKRSVVTLPCKIWVPGNASGEAVVAEERLSFWGGFDPQTGRIVDRYSSLRGVDISGTVLVMLSTKGSSGTSGMLSLAARAGHAPAAIIHMEMDPVAVMGCLANGIPLVQPLDTNGFFQRVRTGDLIEIDSAKSCIRVHSAIPDQT